MTLAEAGKKFGMPLCTLKKYIAWGLIRGDASSPESGAYEEEDFENLGLICMLLRAGFSEGEAREYLLLPETREGEEGRIRMLRKKRCSLLTQIHEKQRLLDSLDYLIWEKKSRWA